jgi:4-hydroxythreonine-4-phosphate dehydrogenase
MSSKSILNVGISMGDPNGVGPEIIIKTLRHESLRKYFVPIVYGNPAVFIAYCKQYEIKDFRFNLIKDASEAKQDEINLVATGNKDFNLQPGTSSQDAGKEAFQALQKMTEQATEGKLQALVTAPLDKGTIEIEGSKFTGHTGYLAEQFEVEDYMMLLSSDELKVGLVTEHLALTDVAASLNTELIISKANMLYDTLVKDFSVVKPKIAVLGLNPHNGDKGTMGEEESTIIQPAIEQLKSEGKLIFGPYPADGFFGNRIFTQFDAVLAMYHDQGLIPFKYIAFEDGINYTAGLSIIRTSPDHGTAFDIAGKGTTSVTSFMTALFEALSICYRRNENEDMKANFLKFSELKPERFKMNFSL